MVNLPRGLTLGPQSIFYGDIFHTRLGESCHNQRQCHTAHNIVLLKRLRCFPATLLWVCWPHFLLVLCSDSVPNWCVFTFSLTNASGHTWRVVDHDKGLIKIVLCFCVLSTSRERKCPLRVSRLCPEHRNCQWHQELATLHRSFSRTERGPGSFQQWPARSLSGFCRTNASCSLVEDLFWFAAKIILASSGPCETVRLVCKWTALRGPLLPTVFLRHQTQQWDYRFSKLLLMYWLLCGALFLQSIQLFLSQKLAMRKWCPLLLYFDSFFAEYHHKSYVLAQNLADRESIRSSNAEIVAVEPGDLNWQGKELHVHGWMGGWVGGGEVNSAVHSAGSGTKAVPIQDKTPD